MTYHRLHCGVLALWDVQLHSVHLHRGTRIWTMALQDPTSLSEATRANVLLCSLFLHENLFGENPMAEEIGEAEP